MKALNAEKLELETKLHEYENKSADLEEIS